MRLCPNARSACVAAQYPTSIHHQKHLYVHSTGHTSQRSRCCAAAGASQPRPTSQGGLPFHPTALLDISCSACCLVLLANSAARSLANRPEPRAAAGTDLQQQGRTSTGHAASDPQQTDAHGTPPTTSCHSDGEATAKTSAAVLLPPAEVAARGPDTRLAAQHGLAGEVVLALLLVSSLSNAVYKIGAGRWVWSLSAPCVEFVTHVARSGDDLPQGPRYGTRTAREELRGPPPGPRLGPHRCTCRTVPYVPQYPCRNSPSHDPRSSTAMQSCQSLKPHSLLRT